jgi:hypothetical protein
MTERDTCTRAEAFAGVNFNEERLKKRFRQTMETLSKDPQKSTDLFDNPVGSRTSPVLCTDTKTPGKIRIEQRMRHLLKRRWPEL